jgi:hypothetical protein
VRIFLFRELSPWSLWARELGIFFMTYTRWSRVQRFLILMLETNLVLQNSIPDSRFSDRGTVFVRPGLPCSGCVKVLVSYRSLETLTLDTRIS